MSLYDKLKVYGERNTNNPHSVGSLKEIVEIVTEATAQTDDIDFIQAEYPEMLTALQAWNAVINVSLEVSLKDLLGNGMIVHDKVERYGLLTLRLALAAFGVGYEIGRMRNPVSDSEIRALFGQLEVQ